jgi:hypothetical protein
MGVAPAGHLGLIATGNPATLAQDRVLFLHARSSALRSCCRPPTAIRIWELAAALKTGNQKAVRWRKRFLRFDLAGLVKDASRPVTRHPSQGQRRVDPQDNADQSVQGNPVEHAHVGR